MYDLVQVGEHTYYIDSLSKVGIWIAEDGAAWLIDSGNDADAGKKILKRLEDKGWKLSAVLNTHSHADHTGGNRILQNRTGCRIFGNGMERAFSAHPILKPTVLYGGHPPKPLRNKFLMGAASEAEQISEANLPSGLTPIPLKGHFFDMTGFSTPDGVFFLADCLIGTHALKKHPISFLCDVQGYLDTLDAVEGLEGRMFIPAHGDAVPDIKPLVRENREKIYDNITLIMELCRTPIGFEDLLSALFERFGLSLDWSLYALAGSTLRSYLSYLLDGDKVKANFEKTRLLWTAR